MNARAADLRPPSSSPRSSGQTATALVVDRDPVSRRFVELALARGGEFVVEAAESAVGAMEILHRQLIDLIIADTDLPDMNGLRLYRSLAQESRLRCVPFVFLSADARPEAKVAAFRAGVADYIVKPCNPIELAARALSQVERERRAREQAGKRSYMLAGDLAAIGFPDLVNIIEMERRSGTLSLVLAKAIGQVVFDGGRIVHAVYGNLAGAAAFYRFVGETQGHFEFAPGECELPESARTIRETATSLILEGARLLDTHNQQSPGPRTIPSIGAVAAAPVELEPAVEPDPSTAAQLSAGVADPFTLGELFLWSAADLSRWTRRAIGTQRMHVHLVADMSRGVSALLGVGGAATERWVLNAIEPHRKAFGASFFLRKERVVDVILLDIAQPDLFEASLKRTPAITIFAPPNGDALGIDIRARVALETMIRRFKPALLVAIGDAGVTSFLAHAPRTHVVPGVLGEGSIDLRALLVDAIERWGTP